VDEMFVAFETVNLEQMNTYLDTGELSDLELLTGDSEAEGIFKLIFSKLSHTIISAEEADENTIVVKTEVTTIDMALVFQEWMQESMKMAFDGAFSAEALSEEEYNAKVEEKLVEILKKEDIKTVTKTVDIKYVKTDGNWEIQTDDQLVDALLGGLLTFMDSFAAGLEDIAN
ncbi:MAG: hypothetical protein ACRC76_02045, partial [Proteocatella sp.]